MSPNVWFPFRKPRPLAQVRLFCFPYAGGGATLYRTWGAALPPSIDVCALALPGREVRFSEPLFTAAPPLVDALAAAVTPLLDLPFAFFGHSMGALLAFEVARQLRRERGQEPLHLFASGTSAPHLPDRLPKLSRLPDAELIQTLRRYNGTPAEVLDHPVLMELLLPILRADFSVLDSYVFLEEPKLTCPLTVLGGLDETTFSSQAWEAWREVTTGPVAFRRFAGDHFFIGPRQPEVLAVVQAALSTPP